MNTYHVYTAHMSPALNRSSALEHFECSDATELLSGIISTWDCHTCIHTYIPTTCIHTYILHIQHTYNMHTYIHIYIHTYIHTYYIYNIPTACIHENIPVQMTLVICTKWCWTSILLAYIIDHPINSCIKKHFKPSSHGGLQTSDAASTVYAVLSALLNL